VTYIWGTVTNKIIVANIDVLNVSLKMLNFVKAKRNKRSWPIQAIGMEKKTYASKKIKLIVIIRKILKTL
jgi:hypothetical protein